MTWIRVRLYLRHPLRMFVRDRVAYWHEAASLGLAYWPRWHPEVERQRMKYYTWKDRLERMKNS